MATDYRDPAQAVRALCDLASASLPALAESAVTGLLKEAEKAMPLTLTRGPRQLLEPTLVRALDLTMAATIAQMNGEPYLKCWRVDTAEALRAASVMTIFGMPDGKELAMALLLWRGDDGLLYAALNPSIATAALSPPPPKKAGCMGVLLVAAVAVLLAGFTFMREKL